MDAPAAAPPPAPGRERALGALAVSTVDLIIAAVVALVQVGVTVAASGRQTDREALNAAGVGLLLASAAVLVVRRRWPVASFAAAFAATAAYILLDYPRGPVFLAMIVGLVTMVLAGRRRMAVASVSAGYLVFGWGPALLGDEDAPTVATAVGLAAWLLVLLSAAELIRARRDRVAEEAHSREQEARRRVSDERLRIARELHDVVAHNISLVNLQAGVALHLIDEQPEQARVALAAIKDASKEALVELRSVLGVLRQVDEHAPRTPAPGLDRLDDLVTQANAAGLDVHVTVEGEARPLGAGLDLAAFRIVQEALTNVSRHADAVTTGVRVAYGPDDLVLEVTDDGRGVPAGDHPHGSGTGLTGMRERAESVGGELEAGPRPGFGWRVRARFPLLPPAADDASAAGTAPATDQAPSDATSGPGGDDGPAGEGGGR